MTAKLVSYLMSLWVGLYFQSTERMLDLTAFEEPSEPRTRAWGGVSLATASDGSSNRIVPFEVSVHLDKENYRVGDDLIYTVVLRNPSRETFIIPWEPDWQVVEKGHEKPPPGYTAAGLSLTLDTEATTVRLFLQSIFGSQLAEGSLQTVEPGEEVSIRGRATLESEIVSPLLSSSSTSEVSIDVDGLFQYVYPPDIRFSYEPSRSAKSVVIRIQRIQ